MKKILTSILSLGLAASAALAADAITAVKVSDVSDASAWSKAKFSSVTLYPQAAVHMNDKKANAANEGDKAKKADVAALYDGKNIALMVKWADGYEKCSRFLLIRHIQ